MPKTNHKFQENEKVLCFHGPLLYEAKCVKIQDKEKQIKLFVHYQGWNKSWDEWVPEDRVLKINESSLQKQKELLDAQAMESKTNKQSKGGKGKKDPKETPAQSPPIGSDRKPKLLVSNTTVAIIPPTVPPEVKEISVSGKESDGLRKKRIKTEPTVETEDSDPTKKIEFKIKIPDNLKQYLVEDWHLIEHKKLFKLPAKVSVEQILSDYIKYKNSTKLKPSKESAIRELTDGIKEYFNVTLGTKLLYKLEKVQYKDIIKDPDEGSKSSSVYGPIHLLRLFVKLGDFLSYMELNEKSTQLISGHIHDFLKYLEKYPTLFNPNDYEPASVDYLRKA